MNLICKIFGHKFVKYVHGWEDSIRFEWHEAKYIRYDFCLRCGKDRE